MLSGLSGWPPPDPLSPFDAGAEPRARLDFEAGGLDSGTESPPSDGSRYGSASEPTGVSASVDFGRDPRLRRAGRLGSFIVLRKKDGAVRSRRSDGCPNAETPGRETTMEDGLATASKRKWD